MSKSGDLLSMNKCRPAIIKPNTLERGYQQYTLATAISDRTSLSAHRLMAEIYLGDVTDKVVDHIDANPSNNSIENLQICSQLENIWLRDARSENTFIGKMSKLFGLSTELPEERVDICWD